MSNDEYGNIISDGTDVIDQIPKVNYRMEYPDALPTFYSNMSRVVHNDHDICLDFALVSTPQSRPNEEIVIRVKAQVMIPKGMAPSLLGIIYNRLDDEQKAVFLEASKLKIADSDLPEVGEGGAGDG